MTDNTEDLQQIKARRNKRLLVLAAVVAAVGLGVTAYWEL